MTAVRVSRGRVACSAIRGDVGVGGVGAEHGDGAVAGLGGGEGVGDAFADDEVGLVAGDRWAEPGEARVGAERAAGLSYFGWPGRGSR